MIITNRTVTGPFATRTGKCTRETWRHREFATGSARILGPTDKCTRDSGAPDLARDEERTGGPMAAPPLDSGRTDTCTARYFSLGPTGPRTMGRPRTAPNTDEERTPTQMDGCTKVSTFAVESMGLAVSRTIRSRPIPSTVVNFETGYDTGTEFKFGPTKRTTANGTVIKFPDGAN